MNGHGDGIPGYNALVLDAGERGNVVGFVAAQFVPVGNWGM
jgi:hypothetical protein